MLEVGEKFERVLVDLISRLALEQGKTQTSFAEEAFGVAGRNAWAHSRCGYNKGGGTTYRKFSISELYNAARVLGVTAEELIGAAQIVYEDEERRRQVNYD